MYMQYTTCTYDSRTVLYEFGVGQIFIFFLFEKVLIPKSKPWYSSCWLIYKSPSNRESVHLEMLVYVPHPSGSFFWDWQVSSVRRSLATPNLSLLSPPLLIFSILWVDFITTLLLLPCLWCNRPALSRLGRPLNLASQSLAPSSSSARIPAERYLVLHHHAQKVGRIFLRKNSLRGVWHNLGKSLIKKQAYYLLGRCGCLFDFRCTIVQAGHWSPVQQGAGPFYPNCAWQSFLHSSIIIWTKLITTTYT